MANTQTKEPIQAARERRIARDGQKRLPLSGTSLEQTLKDVTGKQEARCKKRIG